LQSLSNIVAWIFVVDKSCNVKKLGLQSAYQKLPDGGL